MCDRDGVDILKDLRKSRNNPYFTLTQIGEKYGFSREYACQLYALIYKDRFRIDPNKKKKGKEKEITCVHNPKRKVADYKQSGFIYQGAVTEKLFMCRCELLGLSIEIPCSSEVDIIVNGYSVDVKTSKSSNQTSTRSKTKYSHFQISKDQRELCHFFACYSEITNDWYIIPNEEQGKKFKKSRFIYIAQVASRYHNAKNKYLKFKNRFDLLEKH